MLKVDILPQSPTGSVTDAIPERPKISAPTIIYKNIRYPNLAEASAYQSILEKMDRDLRTNSIYNESPVASIGGHFSPRMKKLKKRQSTLGTMLTSAKGFILNTSNNNNSLVNELTDNCGNNNSSNTSINSVRNDKRRRNSNHNNNTSSIAGSGARNSNSRSSNSRSCRNVQCCAFFYD